VVPVDLVLLIAGSIVLAAPFVVLRHVNTLDGPTHLFGAEILGKLRDTAIIRRYYRISFSWVPNIFMQYVLAALTSFLSPTWTEKVFVVGYVLGFPLAFRYAVRSVDRAAGWLALGVLPLTVSRSLLEGFYAFCYGMIGAVLAIGLTIRARGRWNVWNTSALAVLLVLTYVAHPVPLAMALLVIGVLTVADTAAGLRVDVPGGTRSLDVLRTRALPPVLAMVPAVVMTIAFVETGQAGGLFTKFLNIGSLVSGLLTLTLPVVTYSNAETISSVLTVIVLAVLVYLTVRALKGKGMPLMTSTLGAALAICVLMYFVTPNSLGVASGLSPRFALFVPLVLLLVCASIRLEPRVWQVAGLVFLTSAFVLVGVRLPTQVHDDALVSQFLTVERVIPPGATVLEVRYAEYGRFDPLTHEASRIASDNDDVDLLNVEATGPNYQENFRPKFKHLSRFLQKGNLNLAGYLEAGGHIDYILVVGADHPTPGNSAAPGSDFEQQLSLGFVRVMATQGGLVTLYHNREAGHP
jgi:hypothetical protein